MITSLPCYYGISCHSAPTLLYSTWLVAPQLFTRSSDLNKNDLTTAVNL